MKCISIEDFEKYKGICVLAELNDGELGDAAIELVSEGRRLADNMDSELTVLMLGSGIRDSARGIAGYGADRVIVCDDELLKVYNTNTYTKVVCNIIEEVKPDIFLISATATGRDLAPRCAARLKTGLNADCTLLHSDKSSYLEYLATNSQLNIPEMEKLVDERGLKMTMPAFGGQLMATIICPDYRPQMATVRPGVMQAGDFDAAKADACKIEHFQCDLGQEDINTQIIEIISKAEDAMDLAKADVIVAVGRGIASDAGKGIELAEELAELLGGVVGATREVVSAGWMGEERMIGQTGKIVRPKLYIALGISGAIQHIGGIKDSDYIIAVNKDEKAPIFEMSDCGIVGDLFDVLPQLIGEIKRIKV